MSETFAQIRALVARCEVRISEHGFDELAADDISVHAVVAGVPDAVAIEDYPLYPKGPCVLVLQRDKTGQPVHIVWGIPKGASTPAVVVTGYRPDPGQWNADYTRRKP